MATVTITWDDINDNEDGFHIYRDTVPLDTANPENLPAPLASVAAGIGSYDDTTAAADTTYYYAVAAYKGSFVNPAVEVQVDTAAEQLDAGASIGDEANGGVYAGMITYDDNRQFHLILAKSGGQNPSTQAQTDTLTSNIRDEYDGRQNTLDALSHGSLTFPASQHCSSYAGGGMNDWYLPARFEIEVIRVNLLSHPELSGFVSAQASAFSSTEWASDPTRVYGMRWDGAENVPTKNSSGYAIPVRRVAV